MILSRTISKADLDFGISNNLENEGYHFNLYDRPFENPSAEGPNWQRVRRSVGKALEYAGKLNPANVTPREDLTSTRFCLAKPGYQYVVYQPEDERETIGRGCGRNLVLHHPPDTVMEPGSKGDHRNIWIELLRC